ncbi:hypothetical protein ANCCAN_24667, partial [Ancylostoma caninum]
GELQCSANDRADVWHTNQAFRRTTKSNRINPTKAARLEMSLMHVQLCHLQILHNLVSRRKDALQDVERYPRYDGVLTPLENIPMGVGQASAKLARDRITQHYDMLYN